MKREEFELKLMQLVEDYTGAEDIAKLGPQELIIRMSMDEMPQIQLNGLLIPDPDNKE